MTTIKRNNTLSTKDEWFRSIHIEILNNHLMHIYLVITYDAYVQMLSYRLWGRIQFGWTKVPWLLSLLFEAASSPLLLNFFNNSPSLSKRRLWTSPLIKMDNLLRDVDGCVPKAFDSFFQFMDKILQRVP